MITKEELKAQSRLDMGVGNITLDSFLHRHNFYGFPSVYSPLWRRTELQLLNLLGPVPIFVTFSFQNRVAGLKRSPTYAKRNGFLFSEHLVSS